MTKKDKWDYTAEAVVMKIIELEQTDPQTAFDLLAALLRKTFQEGQEDRS